MRRIGVDVGGTNTDAVLIEQGRVVASVKARTSPDVTTVIVEALPRLANRINPGIKAIDAVMIGTTHFVNAVVQRRDLNKVAALRLAMPACASLPPFCDWPADLCRIVAGGVWMVEGGRDYDAAPLLSLERAA